MRSKQQRLLFLFTNIQQGREIVTFAEKEEYLHFMHKNRGRSKSSR